MERDLSPASWLDEPGDQRPDALLAALARRICGHAERQLTVAERLGDAAEAATELRAGARRLLRDGESVLAMAGGTPERRGRIPTGVGRILADTAAGAEEPDRVSVPPAPSAAIAVETAVTAGQVLAELLAHAERTVPRTGRIELVGRWAGDGGVTVEVLGEGVDLPWQEAVALENELAGGTGGAVPPERLGLHLAARLARRVGAQVELQAPLGGPTTPGFGTVALIRMPRRLVEPVGGAAPSAPSVPAFAPDPALSSSPALSSPSAGGADELFGPYTGSTALPADEDLAGTPIFAAVASAWFRTDDDPAPRDGSHGTGGLADSWIGAGSTDALSGPAPSDWSSAGDAEWRAAAARAADAEAVLPTTASGLPQRRPGKQMVAPPLRATADAGPELPAEREPERVRHRLSTYQRGLQAGRHRAADPEEEAPAGDAWEGLATREPAEYPGDSAPAAGGGHRNGSPVDAPVGGFGSSPERDAWTGRGGHRAADPEYGGHRGAPDYDNPRPTPSRVPYGGNGSGSDNGYGARDVHGGAGRDGTGRGGLEYGGAPDSSALGGGTPGHDYGVRGDVAQVNGAGVNGSPYNGSPYDDPPYNGVSSHGAPSSGADRNGRGYVAAEYTGGEADRPEYGGTQHGGTQHGADHGSAPYGGTEQIRAESNGAQFNGAQFGGAGYSDSGYSDAGRNGAGRRGTGNGGYGSSDAGSSDNGASDIGAADNGWSGTGWSGSGWSDDGGTSGDVRYPGPPAPRPEYVPGTPPARATDRPENPAPQGNGLAPRSRPGTREQRQNGWAAAPVQGPLPGPTIERIEDRRDPWTGEGLWDDDPRG
ncbi:hypothetical protein [Pseudonocardia ailaonensis]|uniref:hypothetical protein n=1 Tax=Pseudonocardia ailaonensis TaxID=367279 RepID=UPI0031D1FFFA